MRILRSTRGAIVVLSLSAVATVLGAQGADVQAVVIAQRVRLEGTMTRKDAERAAVENAMAEAVRRVAGVRVSGTQLVVSSDSAGQIGSRYSSSVRLDADGHVVGWTVERGRWITEKRSRKQSDLVYDASVRVLVARNSGRADEGFRLVMRDRGPDRLRVRGVPLAANDEAIVAVTATRDAYLTVVAISGDSVSRLVPNQVVRDARLEAGVESEWPSAEWRERGLHFRVSLPAGVNARTEVLAAIATLEPVPWPAAQGTVPLTEFNRWLVAIPAARRAVAQRTVMVERVPDETLRQMVDGRW
ncbi:MAG: DUF4384 domain-containing protein [Gemmatimonadota bacterium]|nr:DUF4384 domain-containing protein [Gemmatimonadota bacterium]